MPGPSLTETIISSTTSLVVLNTGQSNRAILVPNELNPLLSTAGRLLMIKAASDSGPSLNTADILCSNGAYFYPIGSNVTLQPYNCATLLEAPPNVYNIVTYYQGTFSGYVTGPDPGTTVVNVNGSNSMLFVDLRTQSKVFVLPPIDSLTAEQKQSPYFVFKDVYGSLASSTWYISTSGANHTFEGLGTTLRFINPNSAIEIVGKKGTRDTFNSNYWYILSTYNV